MIAEPSVHDGSASIRDVRAFFLDDHKHMALLVEANKLIGAVEREDLAPFHPDKTAARSIGVLAGRTIRSDASLSEAADVMQRTARRRLAVIDGRGVLLGLLCLKASGAGFCSDEDVRNRREDVSLRNSTKQRTT
jgi:predicted transcriptional regulator